MLTDHTILVVDADQETEEKIVSILEAEGYLVFASSGREISTGMAGKISPSLIFLKPVSNSVEGFEICKAIHDSEAFRAVPIIALAPLKGPLNPRYTTFYGIVDYMEIPVDSEELIEKTEKILGIKSPSHDEPGEEDFASTDEETVPGEETVLQQDKNDFDSELTDMSEIGQPSEDYSYRDEDEGLKERFLPKGMRRRPKKSTLKVPLLLVSVSILIVAAGFLLYRVFFSPAEVHAPVKVVPPRPIQQQAVAVLPPVEQKQMENPVAEDKPAEINEAPQKAPPAVPETKPAVKPFYSVQLGAFKSEAGAEALAKTYKNKGYDAFTHKATIKDKGTIYRVLIGKYESRKEALQHATQIHAKEEASTTVYGEGMR